MFTRMSRVAAIVVAVLLLPAVALASGTTKSKYIATADQICRAGNAQTAPLSAELGKTNTKTVTGMAKAVVIIDQAYAIDAKDLAKLKAIPKPPADQTVLTHVWGALGKQMATLKAFAGALKVLDVAKFTALETDLSVDQATYRGLAQGFGFHYCGASKS